MAQCLSGGSLTSRGDFLSGVYEATRWLVVEGLTLLRNHHGSSNNPPTNTAPSIPILHANFRFLDV